MSDTSGQPPGEGAMGASAHSAPHDGADVVTGAATGSITGPAAGGGKHMIPATKAAPARTGRLQPPSPTRPGAVRAVRIPRKAEHHEP